MKRATSPFKWRHYAPDVILLCVRWYCRYQLSYRELEEILDETYVKVGKEWKYLYRAADSAGDTIEFYGS